MLADTPQSSFELLLSRVANLRARQPPRPLALALTGVRAPTAGSGWAAYLLAYLQVAAEGSLDGVDEGEPRLSRSLASFLY